MLSASFTSTSLNNSILMLCSSMLTGGHNANQLPVVIGGGGGGQLETGRILDCMDKPNRRICSLYLLTSRKGQVRNVSRTVQCADLLPPRSPAEVLNSLQNLFPMLVGILHAIGIVQNSSDRGVQDTLALLQLLLRISANNVVSPSEILETSRSRAFISRFWSSLRRSRTSRPIVSFGSLTAAGECVPPSTVISSTNT